MPSALWAGERTRKTPNRISMQVGLDAWSYSLSCGLPMPSPSAFAADPVVCEGIALFPRGSPQVQVCHRDHGFAHLRDDEGKRIDFPLAISDSESILCSCVSPIAFPSCRRCAVFFSAGGFTINFAPTPNRRCAGRKSASTLRYLATTERTWPRRYRPFSRSAIILPCKPRSSGLSRWGGARVATRRAEWRSACKWMASDAVFRPASFPTERSSFSACWPACSAHVRRHIGHQRAGRQSASRALRAAGPSARQCRRAFTVVDYDSF